MNDVEAMGLALAEAHAAAEAGEVPVGAVAIHDGAVIATAGNRRERDQDPSAHAELVAMRKAAAVLGSWHLEEVTVVVTLEPCAMCAGAMVNARLGRLVFGAADAKAGAVGSRYNLLADPRLNHEVPTTTGVMAAECGQVLTDFFAARR